MCDVQHDLEAGIGGSYYCPFITDVFRISGDKYKGVTRHESGCCTCMVFFRVFADSSICDRCGLPVKVHHYDFVMPIFISRIRKQVRGELDVAPQANGHLKNTFPTQFAEITAESNAANAAALAPHLPPVLAGLVADYFG